MLFFIIFLIIVNSLSLTTVYIDKKIYTLYKKRIPLSRLTLLSILGGSFGVYIGINIFKSKKVYGKLEMLLPLIIAFQFFLIIFLFYILI